MKDFDWMGAVNTVLSSPLANQWLGNSKAPTPAPAPAPVYVSAPAPAVAQDNSSSKMLMIGGGVLALVAIIFFALKKR